MPAGGARNECTQPRDRRFIAFQRGDGFTGGLPGVSGFGCRRGATAGGQFGDRCRAGPDPRQLHHRRQHSRSGLHDPGRGGRRASLGFLLDRHHMPQASLEQPASSWFSAADDQPQVIAQVRTPAVVAPTPGPGSRPSAARGRSGSLPGGPGTSAFDLARAAAEQRRVSGFHDPRQPPPSPRACIAHPIVTHALLPGQWRIAQHRPAAVQNISSTGPLGDITLRLGKSRGSAKPHRSQHLRKHPPQRRHPRGHPANHRGGK